MSYGHLLLKAFSSIGLIFTLGMSMDASAGFLGFGGTSWKEEVLLHDGSKIVVKRSVNVGILDGMMQSTSISDETLSFVLPVSGEKIGWKNEIAEEFGYANFDLLALHLLKGTPYLVVNPRGCLSFNKWGRPNPPYVFLKYDRPVWRRISISEFPIEFTTLNVVISLSGRDVKEMAKLSLVSAESINQRNRGLTQPRYKTILREPYPGAEQCDVMIYGGKDDGGSGGWHGVGLFGKTYEACLKYCEREKISKRYSPCDTLFKGKK